VAVVRSIGVMGSAVAVAALLAVGCGEADAGDDLSTEASDPSTSTTISVPVADVGEHLAKLDAYLAGIDRELPGTLSVPEQDVHP
jgi:hypothetical protein